MKRIEKKYVVSREILNHILINAKVFKEHPTRKINSIYFDTNNFKDYRDNFEGTVPRKKVRVRFYGESKIPEIYELNDYYFEIKKTYYSSRKKKSIHFRSNLDNLSRLINETSYFKSKRFPKTFVTYNRDYYRTKHNIRITVDKNIVYKKINSNLELLNSYYENQIVLEIKDEKNFKAQMFEFDFLENFRSRFSKYFNSVNHNYY